MSKVSLHSFTVRYGAGQPIYAEGDPGATMFVVQTGKVRLFRTVDGGPRDVGILEKGDFFGEMSVLEGLARTTSAAAIEDVDLLEINSTTFDKMIKGNIEIAVRLLRKLSIRLREAERKNAELQAGGGRLGTTATTARKSATGSPTRPTVNGVRLEYPGEQCSFSVPEPDCMIGRFDPVTELRPDIDLTDHDLKRSVSRRHARIVRSEDGHAIVEEIGALNGTMVNGKPLVAGQPHPLQDGDQITIGSLRLVFRAR